MKIQALAALKAKSKLEAFSYEPKTVGTQDIAVKISHCGICHSDLHLIENDWQISTYPLVPGHEIVGLVSEVGSQVSHLKVGDRVGIGWQRSACHACPECIRGDDNLCSKQEAICVGHYGGFADRIITDSRFAFKLPENLASENAAPLLCGGITVYSPLKYYGVTSSMRVGVMGIGGLGHLALQFAHHFGCEVTALSQSPAKEQEAKSFGAHKFLNTKESAAMEKAAASFDFILQTAPATMDWNAIVNLLRPNGKLCFVGVPSEPISVAAFPLIVGRRSLCGSPIGSRSMMAEMLEFAARHKIQAKTEVVPLGKANEALEKVKNNTVRYRMVLTTNAS